MLAPTHMLMQLEKILVELNLKLGEPSGGKNSVPVKNANISDKVGI